jgi:hypothetical protein
MMNYNWWTRLAIIFGLEVVRRYLIRINGLAGHLLYLQLGGILLGSFLWVGINVNAVYILLDFLYNA